MVIVGYACRTDRFAASAAQKKELQVNLIRHFHTDFVFWFHMEYNLIYFADRTRSSQSASDFLLFMILCDLCALCG